VLGRSWVHYSATRSVGTAEGNELRLLGDTQDCTGRCTGREEHWTAWAALVSWFFTGRILALTVAENWEGWEAAGSLGVEQTLGRHSVSSWAALGSGWHWEAR
jgi:hypothetical protein